MWDVGSSFVGLVQGRAYTDHTYGHVRLYKKNLDILMRFFHALVLREKKTKNGKKTFTQVFPSVLIVLILLLKGGR